MYTVPPHLNFFLTDSNHLIIHMDLDYHSNLESVFSDKVIGLRNAMYSPSKIHITIQALLTIVHYYITITIVYELGNSDFNHLYEISLLIIVFCMLLLVRVSVMLTSRTSHIAFIAIILAPMLSVFMDIDPQELYYAHTFQTCFILINNIFHLIILCAIANLNDNWISLLCFISFIDGMSFIIITISLLFTASYQRNKLLPCNILLEITLLLFTIIVIYNLKISMLIYFTLIVLINYFVFNIPFLKTYLIWQYMYQPAKYVNFDYIITHSNNDIEKIVNRLYARIHCMSHDIKWKWMADENTKLLKYNNYKLKCHEMDSCECWRLQYKFMKLNLKMKKKYIQYFIDKNWRVCEYVSIVYGMFSLCGYLYPILWLISLDVLNVKGNQYGFIVYNNYQLFVIWCVVVMYMLFLFGTVIFMIKNKLFVYVAMVYYVNLDARYDNSVNAIHLMESCQRMKQVTVIMDYLQPDIAYTILEYCYKRKKIKGNESDSMHSTILIPSCDYP